MRSNPPYQDERALVTACQAGLREAQAYLFKRYKGVMFGVCLRYADCRETAEDILQEGFVKVFTRLHQFTGEGSLEGWIRRIMVHTAIEHYRRHTRRLAMTQELTYAAEDEPLACPANEDLEVILRQIQELPDGCRTVFNLFVVEGYAHKEIAAMLGINEGTSRSQLAFARKKLAEALEPLNLMTHATR